MLERIRQLREENNLTQEQFAKIFNITRSTLGSYERGEREPDLNLLKSISEYFNISIDYILGLTAIRQYNENTLTKITDADTHLNVNTIKDNLNEILVHKCDVEKYLVLKAEINAALDEIYLNKNKNS